MTVVEQMVSDVGRFEQDMRTAVESHTLSKKAAETLTAEFIKATIAYQFQAVARADMQAAMDQERTKSNLLMKAQ